MGLSNFIERSGILYSVERESNIVGAFKGLISTEQPSGKRYVAFYPDADIRTGDFITNPFGDRYYISSHETQTFAGQPHQLKCYILSQTEYQSTRTQPVTFHIENAYGSVIGNQANVTLHYNDSIQQAKEQIANSDSPDKQELQQIISLLEMVVNNQVPPQKGLFSKFSSAMERNSWITGTITSALLNWLTTQI